MVVGPSGKGARSVRVRSGFGGCAAGSVDGGSAENHASATVRAGELVLRSARGRIGAFARARTCPHERDEPLRVPRRGREVATDALEDARLAAKAAEAAHAAFSSFFAATSAARRVTRPPRRSPPRPPRRPRARHVGAARGRGVLPRRRPPRGPRRRSRASPGRSRKYIRRRGTPPSPSRRRAFDERDAVPVAETDYFERMHLERKQRARVSRLQRRRRALTRYDGSSWTNRVTEPKAPKLGRKPDMSGVTALRRPLTRARARTRFRRRRRKRASPTPSAARRRWRERRRGGGGGAQRARETPSAVTGTSARAPPASPLAARLAGGVAGTTATCGAGRATPGASPDATGFARALGAFATHTRERETRGVRKREGLRGGPTTARARRRVCTVGRTFHRAKTLRRNATARRRRRVAPFRRRRRIRSGSAIGPQLPRRFRGAKVRGSTTRSSSDDVKLLRRFLTY